MKYNTLFNLNLLHQYYENQACQDFTFEPLPETQSLIKRNRLQIKNSEGKLSVVAPCLSDNTLFIPFAQNTIFQFYLRLQSDEFLSFTNLSSLNRAFIYEFSNQTNKEQSSLQLQQTNRSRPQHLPANFSYFAIVSVYLPTASHTQWKTTGNYSIQFNANSIQWKYYLVSKEKGANYNIKDTNNEIIFKSDTIAQDDKVSKQISDHYGSIEKYLFVSDKSVINRQNTRSTIQLIDNNLSKVIIPNLSNPSISDNGVKIVSLI